MADCSDLPGWPPIGLGNTEAEAIGNLIIALSLENRLDVEVIRLF